MKNLTEHEKKMWTCSPLLDPPAEKVVKGLLTTIDELRGRLSKVDKFLAEAQEELAGVGEEQLKGE